MTFRRFFCCNSEVRKDACFWMPSYKPPKSAMDQITAFISVVVALPMFPKYDVRMKFLMRKRKCAHAIQLDLKQAMLD